MFLAGSNVTHSYYSLVISVVSDFYLKLNPLQGPCAMHIGWIQNPTKGGVSAFSAKREVGLRWTRTHVAGRQ